VACVDKKSFPKHFSGGFSVVVVVVEETFVDLIEIIVINEKINFNVDRWAFGLYHRSTSMKFVLVQNGLFLSFYLQTIIIVE
jgi:acyl-ACP thioesterase